MIQQFFDWIKQIFLEEKKKEMENKGKLGLIHWILLVACFGLATMILYNYFTIRDDLQAASSQHVSSQHTGDDEEIKDVFGSSRSSPNSMREYEEFYENKLKEILSSIVGVGDVAVFVNLDATEELVVERDHRTQSSITSERDREGGTRNIEEQSNDENIVIMRGDDGEAPVVIMTKKPKVRGVVVVANGADNIQVKVWIAEAIQRVLDVPPHRIAVLPKK